MNRADKQRIMELLRRAGLWEEADQYREGVRQRLRDEGKSKQAAVDESWQEMAQHFEPIARKIEDLTRQREQFVGYAADVDEITDPDYRQPDAGKRLRDAFVWVGDEFRRITTDSPTGTRMDFSRAKRRPPSPLAIQIAEHYAMRPPAERTELLARLAGFATKTHSAEEATNSDPDGAFLHLLD
jgi:hypothetical protein